MDSFQSQVIRELRYSFFLMHYMTMVFRIFRKKGLRSISQLFLGACVATVYIQFQLLPLTEKHPFVRSFRQYWIQRNPPQNVNWTAVCNISATSPLGEYFVSWRHTGSIDSLLWRDIKQADIASFTRHPLFPKLPSTVTKMRIKTGFNVSRPSINYAEWIFGFLHVDVTGDYKFALSSDDSSEFWISSNENDANVKRVAMVGLDNRAGWTKPSEHSKYLNQISNPILLQKCRKYFIEIFHKQGLGTAFVQLLWKRPGTSQFKEISGSFVSPLLIERVSNLRDMQQGIGIVLKDFLERKNHRRQSFSRVENLNYFNTPLIEPTVLQGFLPSCSYFPSYGRRHKPHRHIPETFVYPAPKRSKVMVEDLRSGSELIQMETEMVKQYGENGISEKLAMEVVEGILEKLYDKHRRRFALRSVLAVERINDPLRGDRFLVDLLLDEVETDRTVRMSEYVYQRKGSEGLCRPLGLSWKSASPIYVIVNIKNQDRWAQHIIDNIRDIAEHTADPNLHLLIVDNGENELDLDLSLNKSSLSQYAVLKRSGEFNYEYTVQEVSNFVKDQHSILFLIDDHLQLPYELFDQVRKHCIEGKMAFAPIVFGLGPGHHPESPVGHWKYSDYGVFAVYNSDWSRLSGMDVTKNKTGDDWEMLQRVTMAGFEVERIKLQNLYQFYSSKDGNF